jgi:hypothetical protein
VTDFEQPTMNCPRCDKELWRHREDALNRTLALALDDRIIALREEIERSMHARFQERVVTAAEYLERSTELLQARFARAGHRVELAQASARFLTTLGLEAR